MTSGGVEALKAAVRRSLPLIIGLVVLGIIAVNVFTQREGPRYEADARVLISPTPLSNIITGTQPSFVDPERVQQTAVGIASSPQVYTLAADKSNGEFGDADTLESSTTVAADPNSDLITFTAESSEADTAVGRVNAVADGYIAFRDRLSASRVKSTIKGLRSSISALPQGSPERSNLQAELNQLQVLEENAGDAQLVQEADSASKTSPAPLRDSLLGLSLGLVVALIVVATREVIDTTVRSESEVEELLSAPVLASVRSLPRRTRMVTYGRYEALFADSYALLASQLVRGRGGKQGAVLAVTSAVSKEGKTTTAANLAVAVARRGMDVILADFDFRKPAIWDLFGLPPRTPGALQIIAGRATPETTLWSVSLDGPLPRASRNGSAPPPSDGDADGSRYGGSLRVLPAGGSARSAPRQSQLEDLIADLQATVDMVILDTPPALLTVEVSELSRMIDMILVVVRQGRVSQRNLSTLRRQARAWPADLAGAVLTDVRAEGRYSYYGDR